MKAETKLKQQAEEKGKVFKKPAGKGASAAAASQSTTASVKAARSSKPTVSTSSSNTVIDVDADDDEVELSKLPRQIYVKHFNTGQQVQISRPLSLQEFKKIVVEKFSLKSEESITYYYPQDIETSLKRDATLGFATDGHIPKQEEKSFNIQIVPTVHQMTQSGEEHDLVSSLCELVDNAIQYTRDNPLNRTISIKYHKGMNGEQDHITVHDNGKGMTQQQLISWATLGVTGSRGKSVDQIVEETLTGLPKSAMEKFLSSCFSKYGVGSKKAVFAIGDQVKVVTKNRKSSAVHQIVLSKKDLEERNDWSTSITQRQATKYEELQRSFTQIEISGIPEEISQLWDASYLRRKFAHIYHYYIFGPRGNLSTRSAIVAFKARVQKALSNNQAMDIDSGDGAPIDVDDDDDSQLLFNNDQQSGSEGEDNMVDDEDEEDSFKIVDLKVDGKSCSVQDCVEDLDLESQYALFSAPKKHMFKFALSAKIDPKEIDPTLPTQKSAVKQQASVDTHKVTVRGIIRYFPYKASKETLPVPIEQREEAEDLALIDLTGRQYGFEVYWNGRLLLSEHFPFLPFTKGTTHASSGIKDTNCFKRIKGTLFINDHFEVSNNKRALMKTSALYHALKQLDSSIPDTKSLQSSFRKWLAECSKLDESLVMGPMLIEDAEQTESHQQYQYVLFKGSKIEKEAKVSFKGTDGRVYGVVKEIFTDKSQHGVWTRVQPASEMQSQHSTEDVPLEKIKICSDEDYRAQLKKAALDHAAYIKILDTEKVKKQAKLPTRLVAGNTVQWITVGLFSKYDKLVRAGQHLVVKLFRIVKKEGESEQDLQLVHKQNFPPPEKIQTKRYVMNAAKEFDPIEQAGQYMWRVEQRVEPGQAPTIKPAVHKFTVEPGAPTVLAVTSPAEELLFESLDKPLSLPVVIQQQDSFGNMIPFDDIAKSSIPGTISVSSNWYSVSSYKLSVDDSGRFFELADLVLKERAPRSDGTALSSASSSQPLSQDSSQQEPYVEIACLTDLSPARISVRVDRGPEPESLVLADPSVISQHLAGPSFVLPNMQLIVIGPNSKRLTRRDCNKNLTCIASGPLLAKQRNNKVTWSKTGTFDFSALCLDPGKVQAMCSRDQPSTVITFIVEGYEQCSTTYKFTIDLPEDEQQDSQPTKARLVVGPSFMQFVKYNTPENARIELPIGAPLDDWKIELLDDRDVVVTNYNGFLRSAKLFSDRVAVENGACVLPSLSTADAPNTVSCALEFFQEIAPTATQRRSRKQPQVQIDFTFPLEIEYYSGKPVAFKPKLLCTKEKNWQVTENAQYSIVCGSPIKVVVSICDDQGFTSQIQRYLTAGQEVKPVVTLTSSDDTANATINSQMRISPYGSEITIDNIIVTGSGGAFELCVADQAGILSRSAKFKCTILSGEATQLLRANSESNRIEVLNGGVLPVISVRAADDFGNSTELPQGKQMHLSFSLLQNSPFQLFAQEESASVPSENGVFTLPAVYALADRITSPIEVPLIIDATITVQRAKKRRGGEEESEVVGKLRPLELTLCILPGENPVQLKLLDIPPAMASRATVTTGQMSINFTAGDQFPEHLSVQLIGENGQPVVPPGSVVAQLSSILLERPRQVTSNPNSQTKSFVFSDLGIDSTKSGEYKIVFDYNTVAIPVFKAQKQQSDSFSEKHIRETLRIEVLPAAPHKLSLGQEFIIPTISNSGSAKQRNFFESLQIMLTDAYGNLTASAGEGQKVTVQITSETGPASPKQRSSMPQLEGRTETILKKGIASFGALGVKEGTGPSSGEFSLVFSCAAAIVPLSIKFKFTNNAKLQDVTNKLYAKKKEAADMLADIKKKIDAATAEDAGAKQELDACLKKITSLMAKIREDHPKKNSIKDIKDDEKLLEHVNKEIQNVVAQLKRAPPLADIKSHIQAILGNIQKHLQEKKLDQKYLGPILNRIYVRETEWQNGISQHLASLVKQNPLVVLDQECADAVEEVLPKDIRLGIFSRQLLANLDKPLTKDGQNMEELEKTLPALRQCKGFVGFALPMVDVDPHIPEEHRAVIRRILYTYLGSTMLFETKKLALAFRHDMAQGKLQHVPPFAKNSTILCGGFERIENTGLFYVGGNQKELPKDALIRITPLHFRPETRQLQQLKPLVEEAKQYIAQKAALQSKLSAASKRSTAVQRELAAMQNQCTALVTKIEGYTSSNTMPSADQLKEIMAVSLKVDTVDEDGDVAMKDSAAVRTKAKVASQRSTRATQSQGKKRSRSDEDEQEADDEEEDEEKEDEEDDEEEGSEDEAEEEEEPPKPVKGKPNGKGGAKPKPGAAPVAKRRKTK